MYELSVTPVDTDHNHYWCSERRGENTLTNINNGIIKKDLSKKYFIQNLRMITHVLQLLSN